MFDLRLQEIALPGRSKDPDMLISWLIDTLCLHRRRDDGVASEEVFSPIHRTLRENLFANPSIGFETRQLAEEIGLTPAAIHHHFSRLVNAGLITSTSGNGWRRYHLVGGSLTNAVENMVGRAKMVQKQRFKQLNEYWNRGNNTTLEIELEESEKPMLLLRIREWAPTEEGQSELSLFMADCGLLGERPGKEINSDSISVKAFNLLLNSGPPLSIDEVASKVKAPKPRIGRILERFRATGMVERIARTDRLDANLWSAMNTQYLRRGEDWMLKKGGFERLNIDNSLFKKLKKNKLTPKDVKSAMKKISPRNQMLLLNLLGGRLPYGYRLCGSNNALMERRATENLERILRRIAKVTETLEKTL
ncbi:MAG: ArsR family transcriptional regulator [Candidatus Poseidoniaceae archaeon]|jgi:DNA-binding transcriptional ArsR family regulator|nr:ArsR family transcriptional regulator [Candidatus Poseidoniaceae archaeon]